MNKNPVSEQGVARDTRDPEDVTSREEAVNNRETWLRVRERITGEHAVVLSDREEAIALREEALRTRAEAETARNERERLLVQMREANEQLVIAALRANELAHAMSTSSRAKDEFVAMLGHELRNPLGAIQLAIDLIAMDDDDPHRREHGVIERQMQQLVRLVDDLLDVTRIRTGKVELQREPIELAEVVARAVEMTAPLVESKRIHVAVDVPRDDLVVNADAVRMTQVVANLLSNGAKYTPAGGSILVTADRRDDRIALRVRDTGIGISSEMLPRVFDLFAQDERALDRADGGMGLGLAIVRSLVMMHGGTVTAYSDGPGLGSEFVVVLPAWTPHH